MSIMASGRKPLIFLAVFLVAFLSIGGVGVVLSGCNSTSSTLKPTTPDSLTAATTGKTADTPFHFSFFFSGSGGGNKPQDSFKMDTNGLMAIKTVAKSSKGTWRTINALAMLEPPDMDTLIQMIRKGNLTTIDPMDIGQLCTPDELYVLDIIPTPSTSPHSLVAQFNGCAADYNLLLGDQRVYFRKIVDWFERMRVKYRPEQPEE
jgi:hypothetical protein